MNVITKPLDGKAIADATAKLQKAEAAAEAARIQVGAIEAKHNLLRCAREDLATAQEYLAQARHRFQGIEGSRETLLAHTPRVWAGFHVNPEALGAHYTEHILREAVVADWPRVQAIFVQKADEALAAVDALEKELGALPK